MFWPPDFILPVENERRHGGPTPTGTPSSPTAPVVDTTRPGRGAPVAQLEQSNLMRRAQAIRQMCQHGPKAKGATGLLHWPLPLPGLELERWPTATAISTSASAVQWCTVHP